MKTIRSKTVRPLRVPLPLRKVLHLGPRQTGQVAAAALDHPPLKRMIEAGDIEVVGDGHVPAPSAADGAAHEQTHGFHTDTGSHQRGNR